MSQSASIQRSRKFPPFSHDVPAIEGRTVWISAGPDAWDRAKRWKADGRPGLVAPPNENPSAFDWPIDGRQVALIATDMDRDSVVALVDCLIASRASVIAVLFGPASSSQAEILVPGRDI